MTRVKVTYVALNADGNTPIASAGTFEDLRKALDEYYGVENGQGEYMDFYIYDTKYPDAYEGYFIYKSKWMLHDKPMEDIDKIKVYCVDFYPHTIYNVNNETIENKEQTIVSFLINELIQNKLMALRYDSDNVFNEVIKKATQFEKSIIEKVKSYVESRKDGFTDPN